MATITRKSSESAAQNGAASTRARRNVAAPREFLLSADQYLKMADQGFFEGRRVELIKGKVIEMAAMNDPHWWGLACIDRALRKVFTDSYLVASQVPLHLSETSEPEPNAMVLAIDWNHRPSRKPTTALLVVEVSDATLAYDRTTKARLYAEAGISEYWIVNLRARQLEVHRAPQNGKYSEVRVLAKSESVSPLAAPDATILISDLLP